MRLRFLDQHGALINAINASVTVTCSMLIPMNATP